MPLYHHHVIAAANNSSMEFSPFVKVHSRVPFELGAFVMRSWHSSKFGCLQSCFGRTRIDFSNTMLRLSTNVASSSFTRGRTGISEMAATCGTPPMAFCRNFGASTLWEEFWNARKPPHAPVA